MPSDFGSVTSRPSSANISWSSASFPALRVASRKTLLLTRERTELRSVERPNSIQCELEQLVELIAVESPVFARSLHFDEPSFAAHDDVHVDLGSHIFL